MFSSFFQFWKTHRWKQENAEHQGWMLKGGGSRDQDQICPLSLLEGKEESGVYPETFAGYLRLLLSFFPFSFRISFPYTCFANLSHPIQPRVLLSIQKLFNQLKLSCVFLRGSLFSIARMSQYSWSVSSVFQNFGASHSHNSDFKYTLTFPFNQTSSSFPNCIRASSSLLSCSRHPSACGLGVNICPFQSHPMWLCLCFRSRRVIILRLGLH